MLVHIGLRVFRLSSRPVLSDKPLPDGASLRFVLNPFPASGPRKLRDQNEIRHHRAKPRKKNVKSAPERTFRALFWGNQR